MPTYAAGGAVPAQAAHPGRRPAGVRQRRQGAGRAGAAARQEARTLRRAAFLFRVFSSRAFFSVVLCPVPTVCTA